MRISSSFIATDTQIADLVITGAKIANATLTGAKLASATVTGGNIAATTVTGGNIAGLTITGAQIANTTIANDKIIDNTITTTKLNLAVTSFTTVNLPANATWLLPNHRLVNVRLINWTSYQIFATGAWRDVTTSPNTIHAFADGTNFRVRNEDSASETTLTVVEQW